MDFENYMVPFSCSSTILLTTLITRFSFNAVFFSGPKNNVKGGLPYQVSWSPICSKNLLDALIRWRVSNIMSSEDSCIQLIFFCKYFPYYWISCYLSFIDVNPTNLLALKNYYIKNSNCFKFKIATSFKINEKIH